MTGEPQDKRHALSRKSAGLSAFEKGDEAAATLLASALKDEPYDGGLLIAHAASLLRSGEADPFDRIESVLNQSPDWVEGHKALARLKAETQADNPLATIEAALERLPKHPGLWMAYLTLLGSSGRHSEAAQHTARLRQRIADLPELRLVEARHRGFAGEYEAAQSLLTGLPAHLPELGFERARCALRLGQLDEASDHIQAVVDNDPGDTGAWALAELCWRASADPRHQWLCLDDALFSQRDLGLSAVDLDRLAESLRALHVTRSAPLGQSVEGGTQTHGNLRLRDDLAIAGLFERIDGALAEYVHNLPKLDAAHPLAQLTNKAPRISASWSILLQSGGRHVPHLHDGGRISSAVHIAVPGDLKPNEGALELGRSPEDIPLELPPIARFAPKPGHLVLFPSFVYHSTSRFGDGERLTVAFDAG